MPQSARPSEPTLSFNARSGALFTPDEVRALMQVEFERSQRYRIPMCCLALSIDRLPSLETYYGRSAGEEVLEQVVGTIARSTRSSDFLGCRVDDRIIAVFPHTSPEAGSALAGRILENVRKLQVQVGQKPLRITVSVGLSHNQQGTDISFATLVSVAEDGLEVADSAGGDRLVETELYQLHERRSGSHAQPVQVGSAELEVANELGDAEDFDERAQSLTQGILDEALGRLAQTGEGEEASGVTGTGADCAPESFADSAGGEELLELHLQERLAEREQELLREAEQHAAALESKEADYRREIENLQRRVAKLTRSLTDTEGELKRVAELKETDDGLASIYREVQGLDPEEDDSGAKMEMMSSIFEANMALQGRKAS